MPHVTTNGISLYYDERGAGEPLLLIMGITAPGSVWQKHADYWQQNFRCIMPDNRGVGRSDKPAGPYTTAQMADDYAGLIDQLGLGKVRVVGVSMGSTIAQQLALRHADKVHSLVLMCPWARCDRTAEAIFRHMATIKARLRPEEFANYIQLLIYAKRSWDDEATYADLLAGRTAAATDESPQPLHGLEAQAEACITHNTLADLPQITQPCLVIGGRQDMFTPVWMAEEVAGAIPNAQLHLYDNAGHAFHWECIDDFNSRVMDWLLTN
ncbi:alpha/beta hydrolase [Fibrella sp. HMF5335]|uniref:Alpha/beta hydrolase n=1 Tax=Fibrella rubiginis TaxID=2817060 RepID=A0A939K711_9BACT|nr:alpha/beta hydrolase [Fibrella rubiginis]MBO0938891.1 alpha/beta hydrolase [Fibrella rubiginis]